MLRVFQGILIGLCLLLTACSGSDSGQTAGTTTGTSQQTFKWKMVTTWPANYPVFQEAAEKFAADIKIMSQGRLDIHVYAGGELVPPLQVFDAVSQGTVEMGHGSPYYWAGKVPEAQFFSSVPFGMTAKGMNAWIYHGGGLELWKEVYAPFNVIPMPMGNTGVQMGGWFNKKIDSLEDIKGLRMRIPGLGGKVFKRAGGNPVLLPGSEVYTALERGTIDATEWVAPFHDMRLGLNRAAKYYYFPGWHEPGTVFELMVNSQAWAELPDDLQLMVETTAAAVSEWIYAQMEFNNHVALQELRSKQNIEILEFPPEVLAELKRLTKVTLDDEASNDAKFKRVYDAYTAFSESYKDWSKTSDEAYQRALGE
ncbi:MAG: ABC transporter substrate-binding protein [Gammaproteobacteria bacterium]|nr:MAG: ABC transporter substrate-binding protein [Gammaproteobacteria bacterium]RKZ71205.1 MAG: ABC transporter substrate-binding protein [Gammaproteobacteria bacterium]